MKYIFYVGWLILLITSCRENVKKQVNSRSVELIFQNFPVDSVSFRVHHIITGEEIFSRQMISLKDPIEIPGLEEDVYIAVLSWPKTLISHQTFKNRSFDRETGEDWFEFTKPLFLTDKSKTTYTMVADSTVSAEDIEMEGAENVKFHHAGCTDCDLADAYWQLFNGFFARKQHRLDSIKNIYYTHINNSDLKKGKEAFLEMESIKTHFMKDDILDAEIKEMVSKHHDNPVSTFFLFYQLYNYREFDKFLPAFRALNGEAKNIKYYNMIAKRYR